MSSFDDFLGMMEIREIRDIRENPSKPILPPYSPIVPNPQLDRKSRMSRMSRISGADPYDAEERLAIQQEGREISSLPDKPIFSLAEQAALVLDGYNGDREQAAADLRVVARNFALADYVEAGIVPLESPQPSLAESTTPMTPDRGVDDIAGFEGLPEVLTEHKPDHERDEYWPRSPKGLADAMRRYSPALRQMGIKARVDNARRKDGIHCELARQITDYSCQPQVPGNEVHHVHHVHPAPKPEPQTAEICPQCSGSGCPLCWDTSDDDGLQEEI